MTPPTLLDKPPPDAPAAPEGATDQSASQAARLRCNRTACTCEICSTVDHPAPARLRAVSPVAEFIALRATFGARRCACREVSA